MYEVTILPMAQIASDAQFNCRGAFGTAQVADLVESIRTSTSAGCPTGLQFPIVVRLSDCYPGKVYQVVAGHRRYRAFEVLQRQEIPAFIRDLTDAEAHVLNLRENLDRQNLNVVQEAHALAHLRQAGLSLRKIAAAVGMRHTWVQERVLLLDFEPAVQADFAAGLLKPIHIRGIAKSKDRVAEANEIKNRVKKKPTPRSARLGVPTTAEVTEMATEIIKRTGGASLASRALAWFAGQITADEFLESFGRLD